MMGAIFCRLDNGKEFKIGSGKYKMFKISFFLKVLTMHKEGDHQRLELELHSSIKIYLMMETLDFQYL